METLSGAVANTLIENHGFVVDLARFAEGSVTERQVKKKWKFDSETWTQLGEDESLVQAIEDEKIRRSNLAEGFDHVFATADMRGVGLRAELYMTSNRLTPNPSAMNLSSAGLSRTNTTSASPRRPMSSA